MTNTAEIRTGDYVTGRDVTMGNETAGRVVAVFEPARGSGRTSPVYAIEQRYADGSARLAYVEAVTRP